MMPTGNNGRISTASALLPNWRNATLIPKSSGLLLHIARFFGVDPVTPILWAKPAHVFIDNSFFVPTYLSHTH